MYLKVKNNSFELLAINSLFAPVKAEFKEQNSNCNELFETIKIEDGKIFNLNWHQQRVNRAYGNYFNTYTKLNLKQALTNIPKNGLYRAKIIYNRSGLHEYSYHIYKKREISTLLLIENNNFNYNFKSTNRDYFNKIKKQFKNFDEIILTYNGYLQDTTIANIALFHTESKQWHTPKEPLLLGTTLSRYLELNKVIPKSIHYKELNNYSKIATLNAMVDFNIL